MRIVLGQCFPVSQCCRDDKVMTRACPGPTIDTWSAPTAANVAFHQSELGVRDFRDAKRVQHDCIRGPMRND